MLRNTYMACLVEFMHRVAVASVDDVCLDRKVLFCLCFMVLIAKAFNCAHKQQKEIGIRDLGHYAALLPVVGLPQDSYTQ